MRTISKIAFSNDKRNRTRSVLIMTAICLTTMLLVIISTIGNGLIRLQKDQAASSYGSNYGLFIAADGTQLKEMESILLICISTVAGRSSVSLAQIALALSALLMASNVGGL